MSNKDDWAKAMNDPFLDKDHQISLHELVKMINSEIQWCYKNPEMVTPEFKDGFIKGLEQAKYFAVKLAKG